MARATMSPARPLVLARPYPGWDGLQGTIASMTFPARRSLHANLSDFDGDRRARRDRRQDAAAVADPRGEIPEAVADLSRHFRGDARQSWDRWGSRCTRRELS